MYISVVQGEMDMFSSTAWLWNVFILATKRMILTPFLYSYTWFFPQIEKGFWHLAIEFNARVSLWTGLILTYFPNGGFR